MSVRGGCAAGAATDARAVVPCVPADTSAAEPSPTRIVIDKGIVNVASLEFESLMAAAPLDCGRARDSDPGLGLGGESVRIGAPGAFAASSTAESIARLAAGRLVSRPCR